ncbi:hypothetical protein TNIN_43961 [Trichonephila inaurata madagascariensis]|uniref:Uncharacterized protein n=1 Tax=Trichonephila inaurata madagascariensis TaxID=2747483 RepID=A0A8X7BN93_9ARAC|nr:hypothetical protein TNIN_43961 [Trichonephila inaurata madagascariensis]
MQGRISETAEDREERLECQRNVTRFSRMVIWKDKENAANTYNPSIHYKDAVVSEGNVSDVGQLIILPSRFKGSPRYKHERTQDVMTYA